MAEGKNTSKRSVSVKKRFEVFKRDNFTCQYCNAKPPKVPLEVDHIHPVCKGGNNSIDNLITACFDCNRGKSGNELTSFPSTLADKMEKIKLAKSQYKQYQKLLKEKKTIIDAEIEAVKSVYNNIYEEWLFSDKFKISVKKFIDKLGVDEVLDAMEISCIKVNNEHDCLRYFCGVCWGKIRDNE